MHVATKQESQVLAEVRGGVGILTLNRPAALNALTLRMVRELEQVLEGWETNDVVKVVVIRGAGEKAFCAGGDIRAICDSFKAGNQEYLDFFREEYLLDREIYRYPKPTVAIMGGYVMGGGMGLSQGCKVRIVTDTSRLAMPEVGIGYFPDVGGSYFLSRLPGALGLYLGLTGLQIKAGDAIYCGLADVYVAQAHPDQVVDSLSDMKEGASLKAVEAAIRALAGDRPDAPLERLRPAIDLHFSKASIQEILDSLQSEKRPEFAEWAAQTGAVMEARSPIAMCVTHEQLRRGATMSLEECLEMEFRMDQEWLPRGDMVEGVRAVIVDKDKQPKWNPPTLAEVSRELVQSFFVARPHHRLLGRRESIGAAESQQGHVLQAVREH